MLSLTGVLLAAFLPTFLRAVHTSKLSEATELLSAMHRQAAAYYATQSTGEGRCLPESAGPYPERPSATPVVVDFGADAAGAHTWQALRLSAPRPLRFSYELAVAEPGCRTRPRGVPAVFFRAHGDLDGDGEQSLLERAAQPTADTLAPIGPLRILARTE